MLTCNDCGQSINDCDRYGCREINGTVWSKPLMAPKCAATLPADPPMDCGAPECGCATLSQGEKS